MTGPHMSNAAAATAGNWFWGTLAFIGLAGETFGLVTGNYAFTLSEVVWRTFNVLPGQTFKQWTAVHILFAVLWIGVVVVWLTGHFLNGWWR